MDKAPSQLELPSFCFLLPFNSNFLIPHLFFSFFHFGPLCLFFLIFSSPRSLSDFQNSVAGKGGWSVEGG